MWHSDYDAGKRIKGRRLHFAVDVEGFPIVVEFHAADAQDRDGAPAVILGMLEKAPEVTKLWADGGFQGPKLAAKLEELGLGSLVKIVEKPKEIKGFTVPCRRWGRGADVRMDVAVPTIGEGFRADP